jgi:hypothetical protein
MLRRYRLPLVLVLTGSPLLAQDAGGVRMSVAFGFAIRQMEARALGPEIDAGPRLQVGADRWIRDRVGWRADVSFAVFPFFAEIPSCAPPGPCQTRRSLSLLSEVTTSVAVRPFAGAQWLAIHAGPGIHWAGTDNWAGGGEGSRTHAAFGVHGGVSVARSLSGFGAELRATRFPNGLGEIRSLVVPSINWRF